MRSVDYITYLRYPKSTQVITLYPFSRDRKKKKSFNIFQPMSIHENFDKKRAVYNNNIIKSKNSKFHQK